MVDRDLVTSKLTELQQRIERIRRKRPPAAAALAEDDPEVDPERIFAAATSGLKDLEGFAREVSRWLLGR